MKNAVAQPLKGFRDFLPPEAEKRLWLKNKLAEIFTSWGYLPLETPTIEPLELFSRRIGEGEQMFYRFKDWGQRDVALRYDQTVPTCRVVGNYANRLVMPFRRYQIQPVFRAEKPQKGRYREFIQADADLFSISSPYADAEMIALSLDIYRRLGFRRATVYVNDRQLLGGMPYEAIISLDKIKKIGEEGVIEEMTQNGIDTKTAKKYLDTAKNLKPNVTIKIILKFLQRMGFPESWYQFSPTLSRSFSYSTGPVWEVEIPQYQGGSVLGGERYDALVKEVTGIDIPGVGFGLGFDRTLEAAEIFNLIPATIDCAQVLVTVFNSECQDASIKVFADLKKKAIPAELFPQENIRLDKQLKYANQRNLSWAIIIGPDELKKEEVCLKDLKKGTQENLKKEKIIPVLRRRLSD